MFDDKNFDKITECTRITSATQKAAAVILLHFIYHEQTTRQQIRTRQLIRNRITDSIQHKKLIAHEQDYQENTIL